MILIIQQTEPANSPLLWLIIVIVGAIAISSCLMVIAEKKIRRNLKNNSREDNKRIFVTNYKDAI